MKIFLLILFWIVSIVLGVENCYEYNEDHMTFDKDCIREQSTSKKHLNDQPGQIPAGKRLRDFDPHTSGHESQDTRSLRAQPGEDTAEYWHAVSDNILRNALKKENLNTNVAKNVILFIGDGMGIPSITAGRILKGQLNNQSGEEYELEMDKFPYVGFAKTYNVDSQVPDSAGTATAYLSGVKTDYGVIGLPAKSNYEDCSSAKGNDIPSIGDISHDEGKSVGIVTTTRLNHATPSVMYAHSASRYWYDDTDLPQEALNNNCVDIAQQLYSRMPFIEVALGGGRCYFRPNTVKDEEDPSLTHCREDGQDLIEKWKINMDKMNRKAEYVWNKEQLFNTDISNLDHLWGMFGRIDMDYDVDADRNADPTLAEMTETAIKMLQRNDKGYFLLVEGGRIDHAHHGGNAYRAVHEVVSMDDAIGKAVNMTSEEDTLIVVSADHSHTFTLGGYGLRGNPIFGLAPTYTDDFKPFTTLGYGNGPGYQGDKNTNSRDVITIEETTQKDYKQQTGVPLKSETHGGEDVAIMARGPMAHLFAGTHEQNYISHVMQYASCVGENKAHCYDKEKTEPNTDGPSVDENEPVNFLGNEMTESGTEAVLYSMFTLELVFFGVILASGGYLIKAI